MNFRPIPIRPTALLLGFFTLLILADQCGLLRASWACQVDEIKKATRIGGLKNVAEKLIKKVVASQKTDSPSAKAAVADEAFDPLKADGILTDVAEPLTKILKFKRKAGKLNFDLPTSYSDANTAFQQIRSKVRGGGGGHGSGNFWTQYVSGQDFGGRIQKSEQNFGGGRKPKPDSFVVEFLESAGNAGELEVQGQTAEEFVIRINGGHAPYFLQVIQNKNLFSVQEANGLSAFAGAGESFEEFCKNHPDFVQRRLLPILKKYGVAPPVTRFNSVTRDHVLALLTPVNDQRLAEFQTEFVSLESTKYEERQAASQKLTDDFEKWKEVIRYAVGSDRFSVEVRARLQKLIKDKSSEDDRQLIGLVASADLLNDKEYLVWLLSQCQQESQKNHVVKKLRELTDQDLGLEVEAWQKIVARTPKNSSTDSAASVDSLVKVEGYLPQMAEPTANLLKLKVDGERVKLDRQSWSDQFNGESIKSLVTRLQEQVKKSNLPGRWFNAGGHSLDHVRHEHVLFEHIQTVIPSQMSPNYYSYGNLSGYRNSTINRKIEQPHIFLKFNLEEQERTKGGVRRASKNKPNIFHYAVRERRDSNMVLSFTERQDSSVCLTIASLDAKTVFQLYQASDGKSACHLLVAGTRKSVDADSFAAISSQHPEFMKSAVRPILARFGIQIPQKLGGPLEIKNAPRPTKK